MNHLTPEMRAVLQQSDGGPIEYVDDETKRLFVLMEVGDPITLDEDYIVDQVREGVDTAERGDEADWNPDEIKQAGRTLLSDSKE